jgi:hypothetical protein
LIASVATLATALTVSVPKCFAPSFNAGNA